MGKDALAKIIGDEGDYDRMFVFILWNENDAAFNVALHLDDDEVNYFTRNEMAQFLA